MPLDKQWDVIANGPPVEAAVLLVHNPSNLIGLYVRVDASQSVHQLVNDLLFTQLDHKIRVHPVNPAVNSRSGQRVQPPLPRSARYPS